MDARSEMELTGGGDTLLHYHLQDRGPFPIPCASFYDTTTQTAASTTTAYPITCDTEVYNTLFNQDGSKFYARTAGIFNIQFSCQLTNTDTHAHDFEIWLKVNGSNVAESGSIVDVPASHGGGPGHIVAAWNFFQRLDVGDYFEMYWCASSTTVSLPHRAATTNPTRPSVPSVILTAHMVSI